MFLIERLFGIGCYVLLLYIAQVFLLHSKAKLSHIFFWYTAALCVMAVCYLPYKTADLFRIREMIGYYGTLRWKQMVEWELSSSLSPSAVLIYWIFGKAKLGWLLPAVTCGLCYGVIFYVIRDSAQRFGTPRRDTALVVYFVMSSGIYMPAIAGLRMMSALCLLLLCFYQISVTGKIRARHVLLCALAVTVHTMAIVVLAIACATLMLMRSVNQRRKLTLVVLLIAAAMVLLYRESGRIAEFVEKANYHLIEDDYFELWEYGMAWISIWICGSIVRRMFRSQRETTVFFRNLVTFCLVTAVIFTMSYSLFHRLAVETCAIMILPVAMAMLALEQGPGARVARSNLFLKCTLLLLLNAARGSLSALKFFEL